LGGRAVGTTAWSCGPDGLRLNVRLTPKSSRDSLEGTDLLADGRVVLKARVRAVAEAGKANDALARLVAKALDVAATKVTIESGASGRVKILRISGDGEALAARLAAMTAAAKG
jgi:uncharacterized protein YggU (UPF0235/DUF167 family)